MYVASYLVAGIQISLVTHNEESVGVGNRQMAVVMRVVCSDCTAVPRHHTECGQYYLGITRSVDILPISCNEMPQEEVE